VASFNPAVVMLPQGSALDYPHNTLRPQVFRTASTALDRYTGALKQCHDGWVDPVTQLTDTPIVWARTILELAEPLQKVLGTDLSAVDAMTQQDLKALHNALIRLRDISATEPSEHDILNAIGAVRGYAEMLKDDTVGLPDHLLQPITALASATHREMQETAAPFSPIMAADSPGIILAVDDMPENRELVSRLLAKTGHTVITAASGEEALGVLQTRSVDVVLLDLMMPGIGGAEVLRQLKENTDLRATPVIMISGRQDMDQIIACIQAGADDYLLKPFNPVLLQARIAAGIERKRWLDREDQYRQQLERNERFIRATFGRYLSDDIVEQILENPEGLELGGDLKEVTIMMSDIRGFTSISEHLPPQQVVAMLNRYLGRMTDIIFEFGGTIDEFLGDAILAVFGAPKSTGQDADNAVRCALAMRAALTEINHANTQDGLPAVDIAIALNTGTVVAGNIGSERRSKYGFVGHEMNVTSRIEGHAVANEILAAESTVAAVIGQMNLGDKRALQAKGIESALIVYPVEGYQS